jgi:EAL domain-containing protein (putative c-di-GMP-specific phosphodiesterase class I)
LKSLPISRVKIDRSFIANITTDAQSHAIVDAIVRLSHSLGKSVVVEGVEDEKQLAAVCDLDSDIAQGFLFSRPIPCEEVPALLLRQTAQRLARPMWRDAVTDLVIRKAG